MQLVRAIKRGVRVQIITSDPRHCDVPLVHRISRPLLRYLIKRGVEVFFFRHRMIHAKTITFDDKVATVGSSNINYRSFFRDLEINAFIRKEKWNKVLRDQFDLDLATCRTVTYNELKNISLVNRMIDVCCFVLRSFF